MSYQNQQDPPLAININYLFNLRITVTKLLILHAVHKLISSTNIYIFTYTNLCTLFNQNRKAPCTINMIYKMNHHQLARLNVSSNYLSVILSFVNLSLYL